MSLIFRKVSKNKNALLEKEHIWVPYALRGRIAQLRSEARGRVLHIGTDDADAAFDSPAKYDTICSVGALAMSQSLPSLAVQLYDRLAEDGRLLFLEPDASEANPDITMTLWNSGFSVLQVERFSVPSTAPVGSRFWRKGQRTIWHNCMSGVARRKLEDGQEIARDEIAETEPSAAVQSESKEGEVAREVQP